MGPKGKQTSSVSVSPPSAQEKALLDTVLQRTRMEMGGLGLAQGFQNVLFGANSLNPELQAGILQEAARVSGFLPQAAQPAAGTGLAPRGEQFGETVPQAGAAPAAPDQPSQADIDQQRELRELRRLAQRTIDIQPDDPEESLSDEGVRMLRSMQQEFRERLGDLDLGLSPQAINNLIISPQEGVAEIDRLMKEAETAPAPASASAGAGTTGQPPAGGSVAPTTAGGLGLAGGAPQGGQGAAPAAAGSAPAAGGTNPALALEEARIGLESLGLSNALDFTSKIGEILDIQLDQIRNAGEASAQELALIDEATQAALAAGESDIARFRDEGLTALREELAPSLGLRPSDTPILDRGSRVVEEATRQQGQLSRNLRSANAQARLQFPLQRGQTVGALGATQQQLAAATEGFQAQLRDLAFRNRLNLAAAIGQPAFQTASLGFSGAGAPANPVGAAGNLANVRLGSASQTTRTDNRLGLADIGKFAAGAGAGLEGLAAIGVPSSRELKEIVADVDDEEILEAFDRLPASFWRYHHDPEARVHLGVMAEDFRDALGVGDGRTLNVIDALGALFAVSRALSKRIRTEGDNDNGAAELSQAGLDAIAAA